MKGDVIDSGDNGCVYMKTIVHIFPWTICSHRILTEFGSVGVWGVGRKLDDYEGINLPLG